MRGPGGWSVAWLLNQRGSKLQEDEASYFTRSQEARLMFHSSSRVLLCDGIFVGCHIFFLIPSEQLYKADETAC